MGWNPGKAISNTFNSVVKGVSNAFNSAGSAITRAITPPGSSAAADAMRAAQNQQATQNAELAKQIKQLQDQIAAANKAAADAEKARLAQEAEAKRQAMIREYDASAKAQQDKGISAAQSKLSAMNEMRSGEDAKAMELMQQTANSSAAKNMGIGGSMLDSLNLGSMGNFANSFDPEILGKGKKAAQFLANTDDQNSKFSLPDISKLTFGGA